MQIREIEYFMAVLETGSLTAAASRLFISQPALSQSIKKLENELGVELFFRDNNTLRITAAGEVFAREGMRLLERRDDLIKKVRDAGNVEFGRLRIALTPLYAQVFFSQIYSTFHSLYPTVEVEVFEAQGEEQEQMLLNRSIDLGFFASASTSPSIQCDPVYHERMVLLVPADSKINEIGYIDESSGMPFIDLEKVANEDFVGFLEKRSSLSHKVQAICEEHGFVPRLTYRSSYSPVIRSFVASGFGVGLVSYMTIYGLDLHSERIHVNYYNITGKQAERSYYCARVKDGYVSKAADAFYETCLRVHADIVSKTPEMRFFLECRRIDWSQFHRGKNYQKR